jgi:hypothetical protein
MRSLLPGIANHPEVDHRNSPDQRTGSQDHYQPTRVGGDSPHGPRRLRSAVSYSLQPLQRAPNIQPPKAADHRGGQPTQYIYMCEAATVRLWTPAPQRQRLKPTDCR